VNYPAGFDIDNSVAAGVPTLDDDLKFAARPDQNNQKIVVIGYSEGALVAERERRNLATDADAPPPSQVSFVMIASPNLPNGGIFARFPDLNIPFFVSSNGAAQPSDYPTTYVTNEYDPYGDFPAYFNLLSLANTIAAVEYVHPDQYYDSVDYDPATGTGSGVLVKHDGNVTYVFVPADHLPLLAPVRQVFGVVGLTPFTEPVLGAVEPLIRLGVDMGYTDRTNADPGTPTQFSFFTPPEKIVEALAGVPGAVAEGGNNFVTGVEAIPGSVAPLNTTPSPLLAPAKTPSTNANLAPQGEQKLPITDTPSKLPSGPSNPLGKSPLSSPLSLPKGKPGPGLLKLTDGGNLPRPGDSPKIPAFKHTQKDEPAAKNAPPQGPGNAA
jgi:hypothetical protein